MIHKNKWKWGWIAVCVIAIFIMSLTLYGEMNKGATVRTAVTVKGTIKAYVEERGRTSLPHIYHVTMPMQGRVLPVTVEEGDVVRAGEIVVRLENDDWLDATKETVDIISAVGKWVESVEAQVRAAKIRMDYTEWEWKANEKLLKAQTISDKEERASRRRYLDSAVKIEESQAMLNMSKSVQSTMDLLPGYVSRNLERTLVKSPVSGTILKRHVWNEKVMTPGEPLLDIGDLSELEITVDVLTEAAVHIQPGDKVEIFGEAVGSEQLTGSIRLVEPEAFTKISSLGVEEQRVTVKIGFSKGTLINLEQSGRTLGLQYRVRVRIITEEKSEASLVPRTALFHGIKGQWQLYKVVGGKAQLTDVQVGLMNDYESEILEGVTSGDTVIVAPESSVSNGGRVEVAD
jgi:HlyD family secretion protein